MPVRTMRSGRLTGNTAAVSGGDAGGSAPGEEETWKGDEKSPGAVKDTSGEEGGEIHLTQRIKRMFSGIGEQFRRRVWKPYRAKMS